MLKGCDFGFEHPSPAKLHAAGFRFALRYVGGSRDKDLTATEARALRAAGLDIGVVFESTAGRAKMGAAAGDADGRQARAQADAAGAPPASAIYMAVDVDTSSRDYPAIDAYGHAFARAIGPHEAGIYAEYDLVAHALAAGVVRLGWQTAGWSGHRVLHRGGAVLFQGNVEDGHAQTVRVDGATVDVDYALASYWGSWAQGRPPSHVVHRNPYPRPTRLLGFPTSRVGGRPGATKRTSKGLMQYGADVQFVQWALGLTTDRLFGPDCDHGVRDFQGRHHDEHGRKLAVDGIVGSHTSWAMAQVTR